MELFNANKQWMIRPPDERFSSLAEMLTACRGYYESSCQATVPFNTLKVRAALFGAVDFAVCPCCRQAVEGHEDEDYREKARAYVGVRRIKAGVGHAFFDR